MSSNTYTLIVQDIEFEVIQKEIKNLHINILPPVGKVRISAPLDMREESIRLAIVTRISRIREEIREMQAYERESLREMISGESHYVDGTRYLLEIVRKDAKPIVSIPKKRVLRLQVRPESNRDKREKVLNEWHRDRLRERLDSLTEKWEKAIGESAEFYGIKRMHTKWGTCHSTSKRIWLNLELGKKHPDCLEYVLVHELVHLLEPTHSDRFFELMEKHMPNWEQYKALLDEPPIMHVDWDY